MAAGALTGGAHALPRDHGPARPRAGVTTAAYARRGTTSEDPWQRWWQRNRDVYDCAHLHAGPSISERHGFLTGRTRHSEPSVDPIAGRFRREVLPELLNLLKSGNDEVAAAALMAIARTAPDGTEGPLYASVHGALQHRSGTVRTDAILALGLLGDARALTPLLAIARDDDEGRRLLGEDAGISCRSRSLAALSLGFLEQADAAAPLLELLAQERCPDLRSCLVLAAAHAAPDDTAVGMAARKLLVNPREDRKVRGQAAIALSRMQGYVARSALPSMVEALSSKLDQDLRSSVTIAVGALADSRQPEAVQALLDGLSNASDTVRQMTWIAIGRSLENDPIAQRADERRETAVMALVNGVLRPDHDADRPWAALALAIAVREDAADSPLRRLAQGKLREQYTRETDPSHAGALAIALGLMRDPDSARRLMTDLPGAAPELKESIVQGLGLAGHELAQRSLLTLLADHDISPRLRYETSRALGNLWAPETVDVLTDLMQGHTTRYPRDSVAYALGGYRQASAIDTLLEMVDRPVSGEGTRTQAIAALAEIGERSGLAWFSVYSVDCNHHENNPALSLLLP